MNIHDIIVSRRSIRKYNDKPVHRQTINQIIAAGMWAPTACNKQEYRFIYLQDKETLNQLTALGTAHFVKDCNQAILVLYDNRIDNLEYRDDILSAGAIIQNMLLQAAQLQVATCWVCNLPSKASLRKLLDIPPSYDPIALITLGYTDNTPQQVARKHTLDEVVFTDRFDRSQDKTQAKSGIKLFVRKRLRQIYIRLPKTAFLKKLVDRYEKKFDN
ncbi:MAG: nitroreductase family protein [Christensenellales bacterium]